MLNCKFFWSEYSKFLLDSFRIVEIKSVKIMLAGVGMNLLTAFVLFTGLSLIGMPQVIPDQFQVSGDAKVVRDYENKGIVRVGRVSDGSPADKAGIKTGDQILALNDNKITTPDEMVAFTKANAGKTVQITYERDGKSAIQAVTLNPENMSKNGYLGVAAESAETGIQLVRSTWSAPVVAGGLMKQLAVMNLKGLGTLVSDVSSANFKEAGDKVTGPVGIVKLLHTNSALGVGVVMWLIAFISLVLAVMNLLPIPALDGGKLYTTLIYRALKKELTPKAEQIIYGSSMGALLLLFILITYIDVRR
jgi:regulator of sigma E protease